MDDLDKRILDILQQEYPLSINPYNDIAIEVGITELEVINRIRKLKENGIIRRIGAVIDAKSMGFHSTLCASIVKNDRIEEVAKIINARTEVTHNYIRNHKYNLWFTLTASSPEKINGIIAQLEDLAQIKVYSMPAKRLYKIRVALEMGDV
ncbi:MAG: Lrp/AsnC family transcriptional regulator [Syntrophomonadaceae bacterium]|nr:Lrp/AsnC family transcriptional regulator [Syntrophomonadaceae bacterium]